MRSKLMKCATLVLLGGAMIAFPSACGGDDDDPPEEPPVDRAAEVCDDTCAKIQECNPGSDCTCSPNDTQNCGNEDEILDHFEMCLTTPCSEYVNCLVQAPPCSS